MQNELPIIPTVGIVVIKDDKVLLVRHNEKAGNVTGVYGLPAGRIESGETDMEAARRELQEEAGLVADALVEYPGNRYEGIIERKNGEKVRMPWHVFICQSYSGELIASEETTPEWVSINEIGTLTLLPNVQRAIEDASNFSQKNNG